MSSTGLAMFASLPESCRCEAPRASSEARAGGLDPAGIHPTPQLSGRKRRRGVSPCHGVRGSMAGVGRLDFVHALEPGGARGRWRGGKSAQRRRVPEMHGGRQERYRLRSPVRLTGKFVGAVGEMEAALSPLVLSRERRWYLMGEPVPSLRPDA